MISLVLDTIIYNPHMGIYCSHRILFEMNTEGLISPETDSRVIHSFF